MLVSPILANRTSSSFGVSPSLFLLVVSCVWSWSECSLWFPWTILLIRRRWAAGESSDPY